MFPAPKDGAPACTINLGKSPCLRAQALGRNLSLLTAGFCASLLDQQEADHRGLGS